MTTVFFKSKPKIIGRYSVVGKKEGSGPLGKTFSQVVSDEYFGMKTHEEAERKFIKTAIEGAIKDASRRNEDVNIVFAGDLLNQIVSSSFAMRDIGVAFAGIYGACSTMALSLIMSAIVVDGGFINTAVASVGSHFATAERQYRTPLEFGNQRPPSSQWTVTGAGATVISLNGRRAFARISAATIGCVVDMGIKDVNNMGAAMAPAAIDTMEKHFKVTNTAPTDYDAIFTGDLGIIGEQVLRDGLLKRGYVLDARYSDCGRLIFSGEQGVDMGGSGCGCSAVVLNGFIIDKLQLGEYKKVLFIATGALLSPTTSFQGESIPSIAHAVALEGV
jgi:stage V sporulation protein AD